MQRRASIALVMVTVALATVLATVFARSAAARDDEVRRSGPCSGPSDWKLVVRRETATTLKVKLEIEHGAPDQTWQLFLSDNGTRFYAGTKVSGPNGYVRVVRYPTDRSGTDRIKGTGVNAVTGESCAGYLSY
jgi:hypothetical protein